ncbi:unnamed protein product [Cyprideis torosa]|uniref:Uncharacterized protein n=1 Tax=Cyprideis torosa TaxID=163714 RepID=A0A7R8WIF1_9CRUS|nr:unnamed protein product [Cyprideis torosa]CAG0894067.1 unnamed protein product [Cyprideis torosa]
MTSMIPEVYVPLTGEEITVDWLQKEVLRNEISQPFRVLKCDTKCITKKDARDGFTSVLYTVDVDVKIEDERFTRTYNLLAKLYPTNEFHQAMVRRPRFFEREIHMYTKLLDQMRNAQKLTKKNDPPLEPLWAKCYYTCTNYSKEISGLILENLTTSGFTIMNKRIGLDFDHLSLALKAFARSHALAYNVKTVFGIEAYLLENIMVLDNIYDLWKGMFDSVFQSTVIDKLRENGKNELADKCQAFKESGGEMGIYAYLSKAFRREHRMRYGFLLTH